MFKLNQIYFKKTKKSKMWYPYFTKKINYKKIKLVIITSRKLNVFSPLGMC
jgi:hypothetical protein